MNKYIDVIARILLAQLFIIAGIGKIMGYAGTQTYMASHGVPGILLPLVILLEIGGGLALIIGWKTQWVAYALAIFSVVAALIFHHELSNTMQRINFMKDLSIAGGFLILAINGTAGISLDRK